MVAVGGRNLRLFSDFWRVVKEFNPEEISREAQQPFKVAIVGSPATDKDSLVRSLAAGAPLCLHPALVQSFDLPSEASSVQVPTADVVIHAIDARTGFTPSDRRLAVQLYSATRPVVFVFQPPASVADTPQLVTSPTAARGVVAELFGSQAPQGVVYFDASPNGSGHQGILRAVLAAAPQKQLAIGRSLPTARPEVANSIVFQTSLANAQFALLSSLPANIPIVGGMIGSGADFVVLTKNQAMMVFRLAALHGRDQAPKMRILAEIAPVVGAGFLWRTVARAIVGFLPTAVAAVPKTAVAFVGTYLVGQAAQYYYATGRRPNSETLRSYGSEATDLWAQLFRRSAGGS